MSQQKYNLQKATILGIDPDARNIRCPKIRGGMSPVLLADTGRGTYVYRFNRKELVLRNCIVSHILDGAHVPAPKSTSHEVHGSWVERYQYCPDRTLFEAIQEGMPEKQITTVFKQAFYLQNQISQIPASIFYPQNYRYYADIIYQTMNNKYPKGIFYGYMAILYAISRIGKQRLYHNDLNSKNILVDADGNLSRLLDLDSVALNNETFALATSCRQYPLNNWDEIVDFYEQASGHRVNRKLMAKILHAIKSTRDIRHNIEDLIKPGLNPNR